MKSLTEMCISKISKDISSLPYELKEKVLGISIQNLKNDILKDIQFAELEKFIFVYRDIFRDILEHEIDTKILRKTTHPYTKHPDSIDFRVITHSQNQADDVIELLLEKNIFITPNTIPRKYYLNYSSDTDSEYSD